MHIRVATVKNKGRVYHYTQLVESFRGENGVPTKRVIANLGRLPDAAVANLKRALENTSEGAPLLVPRAEHGVPPAPVANLRFLDVAVVREIWRRWGIGDLLAEVLDEGADSISPSDVVMALVVQRCLAPGSKLFAHRWFPTTALPELTGIRPAQFNNSRVHRVLTALEAAEPALQARLPQLYREHKAVASAVFLDVTDTFFEGDCCEIAERSKTKEGFYKKAIGIVLACDEDGFPVRWQVVAARRNDGRVMGEMVDELKGLDWIGQAPVVCDRSMGNATGIEKLATSGLRFLVAVPANEYASHAARIPYEPFFELATESTPATTLADMVNATEAAIAVGMEKVADNLFVVPDDLPNLLKTPSATAAARNLRRALELQARFEASGARSLAEYARQQGMSKSRLSQILGPIPLAPDIQADILADQARGVTDEKMRQLYRLDADDQRQAFQQHRFPSPLEVSGPRLVTYFNPQKFVAERQKDYSDRLEVAALLAELNEKLASNTNRLTAERARQRLSAFLEKRGLLALFEIALDEASQSPTLTAILKQDPWRQRRRYDGFVLLAAHKDVPLSPKELAKLYRAKDAVERDFRTIKSSIKLRPIFHHTEAKVRAHVSLCVLALLIERILERQLRAAGQVASAPAVLEVLGTSHLNQFQAQANRPLYSLTMPTPEQKRLLQTLDLDFITHNDFIAQITPR